MTYLRPHLRSHLASQLRGMVRNSAALVTSLGLWLDMSELYAPPSGGAVSIDMSEPVPPSIDPVPPEEI